MHVSAVHLGNCGIQQPQEEQFARDRVIFLTFLLCLYTMSGLPKKAQCFNRNKCYSPRNPFSLIAVHLYSN